MILHAIATQQQFGYKTNLSTPDAIVKTRNLPCDINHRRARSLDGHRESIWESQQNATMDNTLQKGIPIEMMQHIRRGRKNTKLLPKTKNR